MQAFGLEAVLTLPRFPDVLSESAASRHFPRARRWLLCASVHGKNSTHMFPLCSLSVTPGLSSDHSETQKRMRIRTGKTQADHYTSIFYAMNRLAQASSLLPSC